MGQGDCSHPRIGNARHRVLPRFDPRRVKTYVLLVYIDNDGVTRVASPNAGRKTASKGCIMERIPSTSL
jgi:hypothetical protein